MADDYSRVSQGGEGRIRRVTPEENRRLTINALKAGRADTRQQEGWDLAMEHLRDEATVERMAEAIADEFGYVLDSEDLADLAEMYDAAYWRHLARRALTAAQEGGDR